MQTQTSSLNRPIFKWTAWFLLAFTIICLAGIFVLESLGCLTLIDPASDNPASAYGWFMIPATAIGLSLLGTLIITYRPENRIGWLVSLIGLGLMMGILVESYGGCSLSGIISFPLGSLAIWFSKLILSLVFLGLVLFPSIFPDGHFLSPGWKRLGVIAISGYVLVTLLRAVWPGPMLYMNVGDIQVENPIGLSFQVSPIFNSFVFQGGDLFPMFFFLAGIASLVLRWRGASGEVRQQIKWLAYFLATAGVMFIVVEIIGEMVYPAIFEGWFYLIELAIFWLGFPLVIGLAVFKYRLYDIDIIVRRTLQYALLTVLLGIIYFGVVIFLQQLFRSGTDDTSPLAIVISTLVIAALFNPLRKRVQEAIDRRFYRRKYDAQQALAAFAASARDEVDLEHLQVELLSIVQEAMQPEGVSLWLRPAKSHPFAGRENKDKS
jgi:hypothetical protein